VVDGEVYYRENSRMVKPELNATAAERIKGMVALRLRDCVNELIALQMDEYSAESQIQDAQAELNRLYDAFSAKYGLINDRANRLAFADDSSYYLLCSLEVLDDEGKLKRKADMFHKRTIKQQRSVESVDTASEALAVSIGERACVDQRENPADRRGLERRHLQRPHQRPIRFGELRRALGKGLADSGRIPLRECAPKAPHRAACGRA